jgi:hypothetical protein
MYTDLEWENLRKSTLGRNRLRWMDNVEIDLKAIGRVVD